MKHFLAIVIKLLMITIVLEISLRFMTNLSAVSIFYVSLAVTLLAYILGDLLVLNKSNNTTATIADICLSLITILAFNWIIPLANISFTSALISSVIIGCGEWFFHKYIKKNVFKHSY